MGLFKFLDDAVRDMQSDALKNYPKYYNEARYMSMYDLAEVIRNEWDDMVNMSGASTSSNVRAAAFIQANHDRGGEESYSYEDWLQRSKHIFEELVKNGIIKESPLDTLYKQAEEKRNQKKAEAAKNREAMKRKMEEKRKINMLQQYLGDVESSIFFSHKVFADYIDKLQNFDKKQRKLVIDKYDKYIRSAIRLSFLQDGDNSAENYMWLINRKKPQAASVIMALIFVKYCCAEKIESNIDNAQSAKEEKQWIELRDKINDMLMEIENIIKDNISKSAEQECLPVPFPSDEAAQGCNIAKIIEAISSGERHNIQFGPYKWMVLDVQDKKALIITEDIVELSPCNDDPKNAAWEKCTLRQYLNGAFLQEFSKEEQERICEIKIEDKNDDDEIITTINKIYLLSHVEVERYFRDKNKKAKYDNKIYPWWLRALDFITVYTEKNGNVYFNGYEADDEDVGVRPVLWLNLE